MVSRNLGLNSPEGLRAVLNTRLYEILAQLEIALCATPEPFRRAVYGQLHRFYHLALHTPTLRQLNLYPVILDIDAGETTIASELEIKEVKITGKDEKRVAVEMGKKVHDAKLKAIADADSSSFKLVRSRFHPSPKRYFGTDQKPFPVDLDGNRYEVTVDELMQAGWNQLIQLTEQAREHDPRFNIGPFRRAVITYPTVAPPSVRQSILRVMRALGLSDVRTDYDEAVAAAIFYLMREYSSAQELGLESFKARSRTRSDGQWTQNVLVLDIGGGTTDVALIRLTLTEEEAFDASEDRGAGGRYYKISPQLLSSTGHMQLGGELMTLRVFRLLKAMLADRLLSLAQENRLRCEPLKTVLAANLPKDAVEEKKGRYKPGWLVQVVSQDLPEGNSRLEDALNLAERVVPTRWGDEGENRFARLQAFYTLWEHAEKAKKELGGYNPEDGSVGPRFSLKKDDVRALLDQCYGEQECQANDPEKDLRLELTVDQFEKAIGKVVHRAVSYAKGTLDHLKGHEQVDWLILSGQSCNLTLVQREIRTAFQESKKFVWNPERVTFDKDYAKLATSLGACYAEDLRRHRFAPRAAKALLRRGVHMLYFDINNLFSYLPCSFTLRIAGGRPFKVLSSGAELFEIDNETNQRGKTRSDWLGAILTASLFRMDIEGAGQAEGIFWGTFDGQEFVDNPSLGITVNEWQDRVKMQFEVDHRLQVNVLLCRFEEGQKEPHRLMSEQDPRSNLNEVLHRLTSRTTPAAQPVPTAKTSGTPGPAVPAGTPPATAPPPQAVPALFNEQGRLQWRIGFAHSPSGARTILFDRNQPLDLRFHYSATNGTVKRGMTGLQPVEAFPENGRLEIWGCPPGTENWVHLNVLDKPSDRPVFRRRYHLSLDEDGILRIHAGEVPYWESTDLMVLKKQPGCVLRRDLAQKPREVDEARNPFSGRH